ncbi:bacilysin biosynthesis oxidoreductase [Grosmannia clavigera kw1407]|uniref:Bacilysin biosynthesis oxidoreductase n=1 Tax=Grosmannia clavigera (strain kw1407 / UAMH 11150) TaxID=655863 RepID=F0XJ28_GROCL|nr:bacilysin biosynthesis oxidoreductase [Grosmannia clavigera kw1407]EFX02267.1 bacilysin biosynthesis oxidoreductase [Grosmannia clavigera kw1407]
MAFGEVNNISEIVHQSPPVDTSIPYDLASLAGKTILITGGASGFGAAFARKWAQHGAHIAVGDIDDAAGEALVAELRTTIPGGKYHHYHHCDVTDWQSQVAFFRTAVERSATGGIDAAVPNAGISENETPAGNRGHECPEPAPGSPSDVIADPKPPRLHVIGVNLTGVLYSVHLALYWLPRNTKAGAAKCDRHLLLISSIAGILGLPGQAQYTAAKHGVVGLFRALRGTVYRQGIRVNMLCPYFVETNIVPATGKLLLAGASKATVADVIDAGTRFMADEAVRGRALAIGPRALLEGDEDHFKVVSKAGPDVREKAVFECYAHDFENCEVFVLRYTRLINYLTLLRGWLG